MRLIIALMLLSIYSCVTVPTHKIAFMVNPKKNALCQQVNKYGKKLKPKKEICSPINKKDKNGQYIFSKNGGYVAISLQAIREIFLKIEDGKGK